MGGHTGQGSLTPPGCIAAAPCEAPIHVEDGFAVEVPPPSTRPASQNAQVHEQQHGSAWLWLVESVSKLLYVLWYVHV